MDAVRTWLRAREHLAMFCLGNLERAGLTDDGSRCSGTWWLAEVGGEIHGVVQHAWNGMLILVGGTHAQSLGDTALANAERPLSGVIGPADEVRVVREARGISASQVRLDTEEILYTLDLDKVRLPAALERGEVRGVTPGPAHLSTLASWHAAYQVESVAAEDTPALHTASLTRMRSRLGGFDLHVLEEGPAGRAADEAGAAAVMRAMTGFNAHTSTCVQIGGVFTPPALRGRGYARAVVGSHLAAARRAGRDRAVLFTGEENVSAQRCYEGLGFEAIDRYAILLLHG